MLQVMLASSSTFVEQVIGAWVIAYLMYDNSLKSEFIVHGYTLFEPLTLVLV